MTLSLGASACASQTDAAPTQDVGSDQVASQFDWTAVETAFDDWASAAEGGGVVFLRRADGAVETLATGIDPASSEPLDVGDRVRVGSISKVFVATMVMQLVDEGLVDLDSAVGSYVDALPVGSEVSVRQILSHRSGIPNYTDTRGFQTVVIDGPDREPSPTDLLDFVAGESDFDAGSQFRYSNSNYIVAGMLIEAVDERPLAASLTARISVPLGLEATAFDDGSFTDVAAGYTGLVPGGTSASRSYRSFAFGSWAAGGLVTTVDELARFFDELFFGDLVSAESLDAMTAGLADGAEYGLGLHPGPDFGIGHGGSIIGFNSIAEIDRESAAMVIVVVNNDQRKPEIVSEILWDLLRSN